MQPKKVEVQINCDLSYAQTLIYEEIERISNRVVGNANWCSGSGSTSSGACSARINLSSHTSLNNAVMQLQKACNHPYLFRNHKLESEAAAARAQRGESAPPPLPPADVIRQSGKFTKLHQCMRLLLAAKHKILIFTQFTRVLDLLQDMFDFLQWPVLVMSKKKRWNQKKNITLVFF